jgi:hypothetical protein
LHSAIKDCSFRQKDGQRAEFFYPWEAGDLFWMIDTDWQGSIDFDELMAAVHPFSNTSREFEALGDIFERADDNGDNVIDEDEYEDLNSKVFTPNVTSSSTWAALATSPCSDYEGTGVPGGEKVAILPWVDYGWVVDGEPVPFLDMDGKEVAVQDRKGTEAAESKAKIVMGGGVFSRKPGLALTNRPAFKSISDMVASREVGSMPATNPTPMKLRSGWSQVCPEQTTSCEGNVASLGWCADITFTLYRFLCLHPCMTSIHPRMLQHVEQQNVCAFERGMCAGRQHVHLKQSFNEFMLVWKPVLYLCILCVKYYLMHVCTQCTSMMHQT